MSQVLMLLNHPPLWFPPLVFVLCIGAIVWLMVEALRDNGQAHVRGERLREITRRCG